MVDVLFGLLVLLNRHYYSVVCVFIQGKKIPKPAFVGKQIQTLGIGTFTNIATVQQTATLYDALSIFVDRRVSALPVVNEKGAKWGRLHL